MAETLSDFGLKLNYWFLTNRQQLKKWWVLLFLAADVFLFAAVLTNGVLLVFRFRDPANAVVTIVNDTRQVAVMQQALIPTPLSFGSIATTPHGLGRFDFSMRVENQNPTWSAAIVAQFTSGGKDLTPVHLVIPPKSVRYALALDVEGPAQGTPSVTETNTVSWTRVTLSQAKPLDVTVKDLATSTQTLVSGSQVSRQVTQATGTIVNSTFTTLTSLRVAIVLLQNGVTLGVRSAIISTIAPQKTMPFSVEWDTVIPNVQSVEAYPELSPAITST